MSKSIRSAIMSAAFATLVAVTPASASPQVTYPQPSDGCDMNSGPENMRMGMLLYVREVFDDAANKYADWKAHPKQGMAPIELHNDYICDAPAALQPTLEFLTDQLLIWVLDIS